MKTLLTIALSGLWLIAVPAAAADPAKPATLRVGVEGAYPPFSSVGPDGKIKGFDIDIANALCAEMKAQCTLVQQDFDGLIPSLNARKSIGWQVMLYLLVTTVLLYLGKKRIWSRIEH